MSETYVKFGTLLRLERERRGIKLEAVSGDLKIPIETLLRVEDGDVDSLPGELYFRLFAKSYAELLGIDFTRTIEAIREELGESLEPAAPENTAVRNPKRAPETVSQSASSEPQARKPGRIGVVLAIIFVIGLAVGAAIYFLWLKKAIAETSPVEPILENTTDISPTFEYESTRDTAPYVSGDTMVLVLYARVGSWASVLADGDTLLSQMLTPDREYRGRASEQFIVSLGKPTLVDVTLDGRPAQLADPETGQVSQVVIDKQNRELFYAPIDSVDSVRLR
ncbi:MAG: RodZ domain-containing protein [Candidatus Zixiibacteriota bacterium]